MAKDIHNLDNSEHDRREFLKRCGRFAGTMPPAITILLSTSLTSDAIAKSHCNNGYGNGGDCTNPGSFHGKGVSQGGPGAGQSQKDSKTETKIR